MSTWGTSFCHRPEDINLEEARELVDDVPWRIVFAKRLDESWCHPLHPSWFLGGVGWTGGRDYGSWSHEVMGQIYIDPLSPKVDDLAGINFFLVSLHWRNEVGFVLFKDMGGFGSNILQVSMGITMINHWMEWGLHRGWSNRPVVARGKNHSPYLPCMVHLHTFTCTYIYYHSPSFLPHIRIFVGQLFRYGRPYRWPGICSVHLASIYQKIRGSVVHGTRFAMQKNEFTDKQLVE